jgi:hypothetical protein
MGTLRAERTDGDRKDYLTREACYGTSLGSKTIDGPDGALLRVVRVNRDRARAEHQFDGRILGDDGALAPPIAGVFGACRRNVLGNSK